MYNYNFRSKEISHIFDKIKHFVLGNSMDISINAEKSECTIVEISFKQNKKLFVGYPIEKLETVAIQRIHDNGLGGSLVVKCSFGHRHVYFSIYDDILYLSL